MFKCLNCNEWTHDEDESNINRICLECEEVILEHRDLETQLNNELTIGLY